MTMTTTNIRTLRTISKSCAIYCYTMCYLCCVINSDVESSDENTDDDEYSVSKRIGELKNNSDRRGEEPIEITRTEVIP